MMLEEKEAKKKLCVDWVQSHPDTPVPMCQGSRCMAWRWTNIRMNAVGNDIIRGGYCGKAYAVCLPNSRGDV